MYSWLILDPKASSAVTLPMTLLSTTALPKLPIADPSNVSAPCCIRADYRNSFGVTSSNTQSGSRTAHQLEPWTTLTSNKSDLSHLNEWESRVWVHDSTNRKLEGRPKVGCCVGFNNDSTYAHRIYWPMWEKAIEKELELLVPFDTRQNCSHALYSLSKGQKLKNLEVN